MLEIDKSEREELCVCVFLCKSNLRKCLFLLSAAAEQEISPTSNGTSSTTDETASKKRKITGTKRIEFETAYARVASWLHSTSKTQI